MVKTTLWVACLLASGAAWAGDAPAAKDSPKTARTAKAETCLSTGSRIPRKDGQCGPNVGRSYSRADLERTGRIGNNVAALKALDPAL